MTNKNVKLPGDLVDWISALAAQHGVNFSAEVRRQLWLARKYQKSIHDAEHAPATFVRVRT